MATFYDKLKKVLSKDTLALVDTEVGDDFDWNVIPYERFKKVNDARKELSEKVAEYEQQDESNSSKMFTQEDIDKAVKAKEDELAKQFDEQLTSMKIRDAALSKLRDVGALDAELLYDSPKFSKENLKLDANGALTGIDEVIKAWKESKPVLFTEKVPDGTGKDGGSDDSELGALDKTLNGIFNFDVPTM